MELGVHLPQIQFGDDALSLRRLEATVDAARDCGLAAVSANDHLVFQTAWLDGPTALASVIGRAGECSWRRRSPSPRCAGRWRWPRRSRRSTFSPRAG